MRGYGRDYGDRQRYLSGGSGNYRDRVRHDPAWEDQEYGSRGGYDVRGGYRGGGGGGDWRRREYVAGRGYGRDYNDYGQGDYTHGDFSRQQHGRDRGYDRGLRGGERPRGRLMSRGHGTDMAGYWGGAGGTGAGYGGYAANQGFSNPSSRGDYFVGYGTGMRSGYTPFW